MNIEQLVYITEIYKTGSFSGAAKKCHISLPGISQAVASLEKEFDIKIFHRSRKGAALTKNGEIIIKKAEEVLTKVYEFKDSIKSLNNQLEGKIKLVASPSLILLLLKTTNLFKRIYPNIEIEINEKTASEIIESVNKGINDIGFVMINPDLFENKNQWEYETLIKDKMYFCISAKSPLANKKFITLDDLSNENLVTYSGINTKLIVEKIFNRKKPVNLLFESNQFEVIKTTIAEGYAFSLLSGLQIKNDYRIKNGDIIPIITDEIKHIEIPFGWIRRKGAYLSPEVREFLKFIQTQIESEKL